MSTTAADAVLEEIAEVTAVTPNGLAWVTIAVDPLHDEDVPNLTGFPDGANGRSNVQEVRQTVTINKPTTGLNAGAWDLHIIAFPHITKTEYFRGWAIQRAVAAGGNTAGDTPVFIADNIPTTGQYVTIGGVSCYANNVNDNKSNPFDNLTSIQQQNLVTNITPDVTFLAGNFRMIGCGYEVSSTGPELYKSGSVTCWRQPVASSPDSTVANLKTVSAAGTDVSSYTAPIVTYDFPPSNVLEASRIPNSKTWPAKEGVYQPMTLCTDALFSMNSIDTCVGYRGSTNSSVSTLQNAVFSAIGAGSVTVPGRSGATNYGNFQTTTPFPFGHCGSYFSGLNENDVLTITVIWYIERIPSDNQPDLLSLATPQAPYDPHAFEMYCKMIQHMPVAMPFRSNGFGDWFKDAVGTVVDTLGPVMSMVPGPVGNVAKAVTAASKLVKSFDDTNASPSPDNLNRNATEATAEEAIKEMEKVKRNTDATLPRPSVAQVVKKEKKKINKDINKIKKTVSAPPTNRKKKKN